MIYKKLCMILNVILLTIILSSCFDAVEITDYGYVTLMGIERGISNKLRITFQIPKFPSKDGGEEEGEEKNIKENITVDSDSLVSAISSINCNLSKTLNFMHLRGIVVDEEIARSGDLDEYVAPLIRSRQIRRNAYVVVCKGEIREFIENSQSYLSAIVTERMEELFSKSKTTGLFTMLTLDNMYNCLKSPYCQLIAPYGANNKGENFIEEGMEYRDGYRIPNDFYAGDTPRKGGRDLEILGAAIFNGSRMVGKLTGFETQIVMLVRGDLKRVDFSIPDPEKPEYTVPISIREFADPQNKIDLSSENPLIKLKIRLEGNIVAIHSGINYEDPEEKKIFEAEVEKYIKMGILRTFSKCKELKSDVFKFGATAVKQFLTIPQWEKYNWLNKFGEANLEVEVDFTVRRTGKILKSVPIVSTEGKE